MNIYRIEIAAKNFDTRAVIRQKRLKNLGFQKIKNVFLRDVYTIEKSFTTKNLQKIASSLTNPVTFDFFISEKGIKKFPQNKKFDWAIEIGFLPGVTDNIANTTKEIIEDLFKIKFKKNEGMYTSQITFIEADLSKKEIHKIRDSLYNPIIQRAHIKSWQEYKKDGGMDFIVPHVKLKQKPHVSTVNLEISDKKLEEIGKYGIESADGTRRGPLALSLSYMKEIQKYFRKRGRNPADIELESIAQTWSEHCKHTIFNSCIDEIKPGLFNAYIKRATEEIRKKKKDRDFCVSVFSDNSGAIAFDENYLISYKVETHNSPSALDPFGGAITGIVGVNRDTIGFGLGAKPVANSYGFCFADPRVDIPLYRGPNSTDKLLPSRRIMGGVIEGVNAGGNQSGIPTPQGFLFFDERFRGKPLVFVGTVGLIPRYIKGKPAHVKKAKPGDYIVMIGGRVGIDGIHGATFSSEALNISSPQTAVQIGDPITQKKLSDAIVKEARDLQLFESITDNGAGGLSCSVAEMAKESGGCLVDFSKVPLKYEGLEPWQIWVSESQERMTLAVPKNNWKKFKDLMQNRGVEATILGEFTNSGKCIVTYLGKTIMDIDLQFLHYGLPKRFLKTAHISTINKTAKIPKKQDLTKVLLSMVERLNMGSFEFISQQYDHLVQGELVLPPLQGRGRVNADATVFKPVLSSLKGVILSQGIYPTYSDIDTYHMAAASLDTAIRNAVAAGVDIEKLALLDNFCWCSPDDPQRLGQLKNAARALFDYATEYETPFISGKDSMFNDFEGFDKKGEKIKISIPPTLLISSIGIIDDTRNVVSLDAKKAGDLIYVLGETNEELGASEYFFMLGEKSKIKNIGEDVPKVNPKKNRKLYKLLFDCIRKGLIASSIAIGRGGLGIALLKKAMGGMLGVSTDLRNLKGKISRDDFALFSESQGRIMVTIDPLNKTQFEKILQGNSFAQIGKITEGSAIIIRGFLGNIIVKTDVEKALKSYRMTFKDY